MRKYQEEFERFFNKEACITDMEIYIKEKELTAPSDYIHNAKYIIEKLKKGSIPYCQCGNYPLTSQGHIITNYVIPICKECYDKIPESEKPMGYMTMLDR